MLAVRRATAKSTPGNARRPGHSRAFNAAASIHAVTAITIGLSSPVSAWAQTRTSVPSAATASQTVTVVPLNLTRQEVEAATPKETNAPRRSLSDRLKRSARTTVLGDKGRSNAANQVLVAKAQQLVPDGQATLLVVIGATDDLEKVTESLSQVRRRVVVAFVDKDLDDDASWNTALSEGLAGSAATDAATNLWVFLPRRTGGPRSKPDHTLSTKVVSATVWNGLFAADGDEVDLDQLAGAVRGDTGRPAGVAPEGDPADRVAALSAGDVVVPKIAGIKIYADPSTDSRVVGTAAKGDEFVVESGLRNGMIKVSGANANGWVTAIHVRKP